MLDVAEISTPKRFAAYVRETLTEVMGRALQAKGILLVW